MNRRISLILSLIALLVLLLFGLNAWLGQGPGDSSAARTVHPATSPATTRTAPRSLARFTPDPDALKVGVYLSQTTGLYSIQILAQLNNRRQLDIVPLIEPG